MFMSYMESYKLSSLETNFSQFRVRLRISRKMLDNDDCLIDQRLQCSNIVDLKKPQDFRCLIDICIIECTFSTFLDWKSHTSWKMLGDGFGTNSFVNEPCDSLQKNNMIRMVLNG